MTDGSVDYDDSADFISHVSFFILFREIED